MTRLLTACFRHAQLRPVKRLRQPGEFKGRRLDNSEIDRAISVMDKVEELSGYEKSDYLSTLASILEATGRKTEATEMESRAQQLFRTNEERK